jgi:ribosome-associated heat shock protein Hsp15
LIVAQEIAGNWTARHCPRQLKAAKYSRRAITVTHVKPDFLRLDRWLWFTRFYKTRSAATAAVKGGHVEVNNERASAGHRVQIGDQIELIKQQLTYRFMVALIPLRRGPAVEAQACYTEDPGSVRAREERSAQLKQDRQLMPRTPGRPDKHTQRLLRVKNREPGSTD